VAAVTGLTRDYQEVRLSRINESEYLEAPPAERDYFAFTHQGLLKSGYVGYGERPGKAFMCLDLREFGSISDYIAQLRKVHKGNAVRDAIRAERRGYYTRFFNNRNHLGDILAISQAAPERQGRRLPSNYFETPEEQGGYPGKVEPEHAPVSALAWNRWFGLFCSRPAHQQGPLLVDEQLAAYVHLRRYSDAIIVNRLIGHPDHWTHGVMHKLHIDFVSVLLQHSCLSVPNDQSANRGLRGVRYLLNGGVSIEMPGSLQWKLRMLYRPALVIYGGEAEKPAPHEMLNSQNTAEGKYEHLHARLQELCYKAEMYELVSAEIADLRYKAGEYERLKPDLPEMRYKAKEYDLMRSELQDLRYKARDPDTITAE
jgi:hypothetical protein